MTAAAKLMDSTGDDTGLPPVRGELRYDQMLAKGVWFQVGGPADILFKPADADDLAHFLKHKPANLAVTVMGVGSNLLVRDGGVRGVVIRLGRGFTDVKFNNNEITAGAGGLDQNVAKACQTQGLGGLEFLIGVPGTIGGAVFMNAGAYGVEIKDVLISADVILADGRPQTLTAQEINFAYRKSHLPPGAIVVAATFKGKAEDPAVILQRMEKIRSEREASQPTRAKTGGSTFKNPPDHKAWQLIDDAKCRGLRQGGAIVSEKHCNFLINEGGATAHDLEALGEEVRRRVREKSGIALEWEIQRIGENHGTG